MQNPCPKNALSKKRDFFASVRGSIESSLCEIYHPNKGWQTRRAQISPRRRQ